MHVCMPMQRMSVCMCDCVALRLCVCAHAETTMHACIGAYTCACIPPPPACTNHIHTFIDTQRPRYIDTYIHTHTYLHTFSHTHTTMPTDTCRQIHHTRCVTGTQAHEWKYIHTYAHTDIHFTYGQTDRQTDRQTDIHAARQTDRHEFTVTQMH